MKVSPIFLGLVLAISAGCDSNSGIISIDGSSAQESDQTPITPTGAESIILAMFAGASFASVDQFPDGQNTDGESVSSNWWVSFTSDRVTFAHDDVIDEGSYSRLDDTTMLAKFSDYEVEFKADGGNLLWNSVSYLRAAQFQFDSQENLQTYFDGTRYETVEQSDIGGTATGELAMGNWSVRFSGDQVLWSVQDTVLAGKSIYVSGSEFKIDFNDYQVNVVVLDDGNLLIDSVVYKKVIVSQFSSQETLIDFLSGESYRSVDLKPQTLISDEGAMGNGLGYWFVDFLDNTMTWAYRNISQVGTVEYLDDNTFTAIFEDSTVTVSVENDDIIFDGSRYSKVTGE